MRSPEEVSRVAGLFASGFNDCAIARATEIPRTTVRDWRHGKVPARSSWLASSASCLRCAGPPHEFAGFAGPYSYLLGMYLGDGCLSTQRRGVFRLRIVLDARYPGIVTECRVAMRQLLPGNLVGTQTRHGGTTVELGACSKQLPCLFPQHAAGKKHERQVRLTEWQADVVKSYPEPFVRGLIHSDGCRGMNTIRRPRKTYAYPRYTFTNYSDDIRGLFCWACDLLGVEWRVMNRWNISVARRESVARLDEFVGPKR